MSDIFPSTTLGGSSFLPHNPWKNVAFHLYWSGFSRSLCLYLWAAAACPPRAAPLPPKSRPYEVANLPKTQKERRKKTDPLVVLVCPSFREADDDGPKKRSGGEMKRLVCLSVWQSGRGKKRRVTKGRST